MRLVLIDETLWLLILFVFYSEDQSRLAARKYARVVQKLGFPVSSIYLEQFSISIEIKSKFLKFCITVVCD